MFSRSISTMALPKNLTNELTAIYNAGINIKSELDYLYSLMPSSNGDLKEQIKDVTEFVMKQDRWIVLRIDALADVVAEYNTRITSISNRVTSNYNTLNSRISGNDTDISNLSSRISSNDSDISNLSGRITGNDTDISNLSTRFNDIKAVVSENKSNISGMSKSITTNATNITNLTNQVAASNVSVVSAINDLGGLLTSRMSTYFSYDGILTVAMQNKFDSVVKAINAGTASNVAAIALTKYDDSNLSALITNKFSQFFNNTGVFTIAMQSKFDQVVKAVKDSAYDDTSLKEHITFKLSQFFNDVGVFTVSMQNKFDEVKTAINNMSIANAAAIALTKYDDSDLRGLITSKFSQFFNDTGIFTLAMQNKFDQVISAINKGTLANTAAIALTKYDDSDLITFLTVKLSQFFNDTGIFTLAMQNKFDQVINAINLNSTATVAAVGLTKYDDTSFKEFITYKFSQFFNDVGVFTVAMQAKFDQVIKGYKDVMEVFTLYLRDEFALLNDWFSLIVEWLDMIYMKPGAVFESAVFDYERLQEMLDGISFGNVVNEAGTNLWDVLQELISALGGVVESIINIVPDLIDQLIGLIIPENPNFFSEDINTLIDSFDSKFEWTGTLTNTFTSVFSQPKSIKSLTVSVAGKNYKVVPDFVDLGLIKTILTGYFCFLTVLTTYRRIVGSGDIVQ